MSANEEIQSLHKDVRKIGKWLRGIVKLFVAFFLFALLNICIDIFTKHTQLISADSFRLLQEGLKVFINQNLVTFISILSEHKLLTALVMAFACAFSVELAVRAFAPVHADSESGNQTDNHDEFKQDCVAATGVVSYKQKVCFLS